MRIRTVIPKGEARKLVLQRRKEISEAEIKRKTFKVIERLKEQDEFLNAKTVHCYIASREGEVDTRQLINLMQEMNKAIVVPKLNPVSKTFSRGCFTSWTEMIRNEEGYLEPAVGINDSLDDIDLVIVPAVAVSIHGQRIGYGGGYYDKLLRNLFVPKFVLAFEFQIFDDIESTTADTRVDKIITELRVVDVLKHSVY